MINLLLGRPGSGKSYEAVVFHILVALQEGRKVITNLPLQTDVIFSFYPEYKELLDLRFKSVSGKPNPFTDLQDFQDEWKGAGGIGALYVIDECHKMFHTGRTPLQIEEWFAEHRHLGADVLLITQSYRKLSRSIVDMIQVVYRLSNNRTLGSDKSYIRKVQDGVRGEVISTQVRTYDKNKFKFYKSHTKTASSVSETSAKDIKPLWLSWPFVGAAIFLGFGVPYFIYNLSNNNPITSGFDASHKRASKQAPKHPQQENKLTAQISSPVVPVEVPKDIQTPFGKVSLHIGGYIHSEKKNTTIYQFIASQNGQVVFSLSQNDLVTAGYFLRPLGSCSLELIYKTVTTYVICDAPRVGMNPSSSFAAR